MRVLLDEDLCAGHGICLAICPEVFTMEDDEGFARAISTQVPPAHQDDVLEAERCCPSGAITVDETEARSLPDGWP